jgi:tetratricopeptide (TPR) repeat protein
LDDFDSHAHIVLSDAHLFARSNFEEAEIEIEKALELNPNWYEPLCRKAWILALTGRAKEGIVCALQASRLNPFAAYDCRVGHFIAAYSAERYMEAISVLRSMGRDSEARQALTEFLSMAQEEIAAFPGENPDLWRRYWARHFPFKNPKDLDHLLDGLRMAGLSA